jgi:hypothetical protein
MVWVSPQPRCAWAPDYPWGAKPEDMEAELRVTNDLWGTLAYGRWYVQEQASRDNEMPDSAAALVAKATRNACTPDVAGDLSRIWYETDVRGVLSAVQVPTLILFPRLRVDARLRASAVRPGPYEIPGLHPALALDQDRSSSPADELVLQPARTWFALSGSRRACRGTPFDSPCSRRRPRGRRGSVSCDHASYERPGVDADPQLETRRRRARRTRRESLAATDVGSRQSPGDPRLERPRAGVHESFLP